MKIITISKDKIFTFLLKMAIRGGTQFQLIINFNSSQEALNYLKKNSNDLKFIPDYIFVDIDMPMAEGLKFLNAFDLIRSRSNQEIILYICSSLAQKMEIKENISHKLVTGHISKPLTLEKLQKIKILNLKSKIPQKSHIKPNKDKI